MKRKTFIALMAVAILLLAGMQAVYAESYVRCKSLSEAASVLRKSMENHEPKITLLLDFSFEDENIYEKVFDEATKHNKKYPKGGDYIRNQLLSNGISYSETSNPKLVTYDAEYLMTKSQAQAVDKAVKTCLKELKLEGKSDYRKVKTIYDYICKNVKYDNHVQSDASFTAYGALVKKKAVCQGYANLFYRLALEAGVDARIIIGIGNGDFHAWNIVKLGKVYYNLDTTWDASFTDGYRYFLQCNKNFLRHTRDSQYKTKSFLNNYPMATNDYGLDSVNLIAPKKVNVRLAGYDNIRVTWDKVKGAKGYYIHFTKPGWDYFIWQGETTKNYCNIKYLDHGSQYKVRVLAYTKVDGKRYDSRHYRDSAKIYTLKKVKKPTVKKVGNSKIKISWKNINGETGYQIGRFVKKNGAYKLDKVVKTVKNKNAKSLTIKKSSSKKYYYGVRAYKAEKVNGAYKRVYAPWSVSKN